MGKCIACKNEGTMPIRALTVRTIYLREFRGERRVQALGDFLDSAVCRGCAEKQLLLERKPALAQKRRLIGFGIIFVLGITLFIISLLLSLHRVFLLLGCAAILCGLLAVFDSMRSAIQRKNELEALSEKEALDQAAWDVFLRSAPKKNGEETLSYIPVNETTLRRKNGDLMILYRLVPEIAQQAYDCLHHKGKKEAENQPPSRF